MRRVRRDRVVAALASTVVVGPVDQGCDITVDVGTGARLAISESAGARIGFLRARAEPIREQQPLGVQVLQNGDRGRDRFGHDPRIRPYPALGHVHPLVVTHALPLPPAHQQQSRGPVTLEAAALQRQDLPGPHARQVSDDHETRTDQAPGQQPDFALVDRQLPPTTAIDQPGRRQQQSRSLPDRQPAVAEQVLAGVAAQRFRRGVEQACQIVDIAHQRTAGCSQTRQRDAEAAVGADHRP